MSFLQNPFHPSSTSTCADKGCRTCEAALPSLSQGSRSICPNLLYYHPVNIGESPRSYLPVPDLQTPSDPQRLQVGSAPNYTFCSPASGSPSKGILGYGMTIPRNKESPQEGSSDQVRQYHPVPTDGAQTGQETCRSVSSKGRRQARNLEFLVMLGNLSSQTPLWTDPSAMSHASGCPEGQDLL